MRVTVVGAGVAGLSSAVRLAEAGHQVDVLARDLPLETTSSVAAGLWMPDLTAPLEDSARWARDTHAELVRLAAAEPEKAGVRVLPGTLVQDPAEPAPDWLARLDLAPSQAQDRLPAGVPGPGRAWRATIPLVDTGRYLLHLRGRLLAAGGTLTRMSLPALPSRGLVVNCTGASAQALAADPTVRPVRGQVVLLADPGLDEWVMDDRDRDGLVCYVVPHGRHVAVGASRHDGDWSTAVRPAIAQALVERAVALVPRLAGAAVLGHRVGLRPARPSVRVQTERSLGRDGEPRTVVHCYGHGSCGISLAWGTAGDVLAAVQAEAPAARAEP